MSLLETCFLDVLCERETWRTGSSHMRGKFKETPTPTINNNCRREHSVSCKKAAFQLFVHLCDGSIYC